MQAGGKNLAIEAARACNHLADDELCRWRRKKHRISVLLDGRCAATMPRETPSRPLSSPRATPPRPRRPAHAPP